MCVDSGVQASYSGPLSSNCCLDRLLIRRHAVSESLLSLHSAKTLEAPDREQTTVLGSQASLGSHRMRPSI